MKNIAIVGTGAIGGYYGALLAQAKFEVHFLLNTDYEHVRKNGLFIESPSGNIFLKNVNAWNKATDIPKCDLLIITLKTTLNNLLPDIIPPLCHKSTKVLVLQNGLGTDKDSADTVPENEVFGGVCSIASNKVGPGHIKHIAYNEILMGQYLRNETPAGKTNSLIEVSKILNSAGISTRLSDNIEEARWRKLVWNVTFNGLTTVLNCHTQTIMRNQKLRERAILIMNEVILAARSCGHIIEGSFVQKMIDLTDQMASYFPSMKLDSDNGRPLEIEVIYKRPLEQAKLNNCLTPEIDKLYLELLNIARK